VLFIVNLAGGLLLTCLPAVEMLDPAHFTAVREAAAGVPTWLAGETLLNPVGNLSLQIGTNQRALSPALQGGIVALLLALGLLPGIAWLSGSLVSGGLLLAYKESLGGDDAPADGSPGWRFDWKRFAWGCWHYWGAFLLFSLVQSLLTAGIFIPVLVLISVAFGLAPWSAVLLAPVFLFLVLLWTGFVELAQVSLVMGENRRIGRALREAWAILRRQTARLSVYYLLSLALLLVIHLVFRIVIFPRMPLAFWPLVLVLQQAFIFLRLWARASRLAGDMQFVRDRG
jgi:hypothetical protein